MLRTLDLFGGHRRAGKETQQAGKDERHDEISDCDGKREQQQTRRAGHADGGHEPDGGGGCEALDPILTDKDEARAYKADAGDDLCGDTGWIDEISKKRAAAVPTTV